MSRNIFNNMKIGVKLTGMIAFIFMFCVVYMLSGGKVRMNALHLLDSKYVQYVEDIGQIGEMKTRLGKMRENIYQYIAVPADAARFRKASSRKRNPSSRLFRPIKVKS